MNTPEERCYHTLLDAKTEAVQALRQLLKETTDPDEIKAIAALIIKATMPRRPATPKPEASPDPTDPATRPPTSKPMRLQPSDSPSHDTTQDIPAVPHPITPAAHTTHPSLHAAPITPKLKRITPPPRAA